MSDGIQTLERIIQQASTRNRVLASNIANVDTPNYRAKDVTFSQVLGNEVAMITTNTKHLQGASGSGGGSGEIISPDQKPWADKNNVEMDQEVAKMTQNAMLFETGITLIKKKIQMFKNALRTS
jgi:flagellar basal-body rod protein FlgB